jgi:hypothetical protein
VSLRGRFRSANGLMPIGGRGKTPAGLAPVSSRAAPQLTLPSFARRYGGFLQRTDRLERGAAAAAQVTLPNVEAYLIDLTARVRSVTVYNCIYKLRRAGELLAPTANFSWLAEIEKDLALVMEPRSKFDRLVFTGRLVEAGLTLVAEAQRFAKNDLSRARGVRNGLMIALLALCPIRLRNFAALEIGHTFKEVHGRWWIALPSVSTKSRRPDERCVLELLNRSIDAYLNKSRPVLLRRSRSTTSARCLYCGGLRRQHPHLASALLNHTDPRVTEEHYNRATSVTASKIYAEIINSYLQE